MKIYFEPAFSDVDQFIRKLGFDLFDIQRCYWKLESSNINYGKKASWYSRMFYIL